MTVHPAPMDPAVPARWSVERYLGLVEQGVLGPDDRVELLEGVIVAMTPPNVPHDAGVTRVTLALVRAVGGRAVVRIQLPLVVGTHSLPEPDAAVVPGSVADYDHERPSRALLVVEVSDSSLGQDRLTKAAMYAAASVPEYWIVNLRESCIEVRRCPDPAARRYTALARVGREDSITLAALPDVTIAANDLLPSSR